MSISQVSLEMPNMEHSDISQPKTSPDPSEDGSNKDDNNNNSQRPSLARRCLKKVGNVVLVIAFIVALPFLLMFLACGWFFCDIVDEVNSGCSEESDGGAQNNKDKVIQTMRRKLQKTGMRELVARLPLLIRSRLVILCLAWFIVNLSVPELRKKDILGSHLWKWTFLLALIFCGYHFFSEASRFMLYLLRKNKKFKNSKKAEYYTKGLRRIVSLVLHSGSVLLTWIFYFRTSHGIRKTGETEDILHIGTWTLVSLAVVALLWMLKIVLLLIWEANAVYNRFRRRIISTGSMCYFLGHIYGWQVSIFQPDHNTGETNDHDQLSNTEDDQKKDDHALVDHQQSAPDDHQSIAHSTDAADKQTEEQKSNKKRKKKAKDILFINKDATTYAIKKMTKYFVRVSKSSSRDDDGTSSVLSRCQRIRRSDRHDVRIEDFKEFGLEGIDAEELLKVLKNLEGGHKQDEEISYKHFEKSMVKAHKNCVELGHTLVDAIGVVEVLDRVLTLVLVVVAIIAWLLLTDLASTKLLVFIMSPLFGATFIFGGTCKKIFEGIIFTFINHPFDVGDKCIIQKNELEVKRMNVLATTFTVIGTKEEALYPNSALASIPIINLKGEPDPNDQVELTLDPSYTTPMLEELKEKIIKFFEADKGKRYNKDINVVVNDVGETRIKMVIQYQHVISINETTHSQCLEMKRKQRSDLLLKLKQLTEEFNGNKAPRSISFKPISSPSVAH